MARLQFTIFGSLIDIQSARAAAKFDSANDDAGDGTADDAQASDTSSSAGAIERRGYLTSGGPGWFDSSFELKHGLEVREGLPGDARLNEWLDDFMRDNAVPGIRGGFSLMHDEDLAPLEPLDSEPSANDEFKAYGIEGLTLL